MLKVVHNGTYLFRVAKALDRRGWRGADFLLRNLERRHQLAYLAVYRINGIEFGVPAIDRLDRQDIERYERELVATLVRALRPLRDVTLFDCGAYRGLLSTMLCASVPAIRRVIA